jgi:hypothetical protein
MIMSTSFITQHLWPQITSEARRCGKHCAVAVAYFGAGASRLLPISAGSRLVVDASERAVMSGQTCPAELLKLVKRGVNIFSVPNLHAKVFVLGNNAFIGSANVSGRSAAQLVEAALRTTEPQAVRAARNFVRSLCLDELTPTVLKRLAKIYRPPVVSGGKRGLKVSKQTFRRPTLPRLMLAQLHLGDWSERDQTLHDRALPVAKKRRQYPRGYEIESFRCAGRCRYRRRDKVIQVTDEGGGKIFVTPPGSVLHVRTRRDKRRQVSFVYLECPCRRRQAVKALARSLGRGALKRLRRDGRVRDPVFAQALLERVT